MASSGDSRFLTQNPQVPRRRTSIAAAACGLEQSNPMTLAPPWYSGVYDSMSGRIS
jgi:hypothetical protein